jgi:hypothetical protein
MMRICDKKIVGFILCILVIPLSATTQDHNKPHYTDLWVINHSSYHVRVSVDGWEQGSVWNGATSRKTVTVGYHEVYGEEYQNGEVYWGPWNIYVPEGGYELTFYDPDPEDPSSSLIEESSAPRISNLFVVNESTYDARVFVDGWEKGTVIAGGTFTTTIQGGFNYEFYAEGSYNGEVYWGPQTFYVATGEDFNWTLEP